jgi:hypothetical protein
MHRPLPVPAHSPRPIPYIMKNPKRLLKRHKICKSHLPISILRLRCIWLLLKIPSHMASNIKIRNICDLAEALAATPKPIRSPAPHPTCAQEGCDTRQTAEDVQRSKSKGGWLCEVHQKDLALSLASLQWTKREVLTEKGERRDSKDPRDMRRKIF